MRSLPPAIFSLTPYSSSDHCTGNTELVEGLVERRQVAVAFGVGEHAVTVEDQRWHHALPADPKAASTR